MMTRMGTSNRLAQFRGKNFIELLEVDRPDKLAPHEFSRVPPFFSFGDHNRLALGQREGLSILVFASDDARADIHRFEAAGLSTFVPFDFERQARLPNGAEVTVAFTLAFARSPEMPRIAFMVSQNRAQEFSGRLITSRIQMVRRAINAVYLASMSPNRDAAFISAMFGRRHCSHIWRNARLVRSLTGGARGLSAGTDEARPRV